jgi:2-haloacid dehalogenase
MALSGVRACVFDAYGTLFDVTAAANRCRGDIGERWQPFAELWRTKQLQYTWLRSLMGRHADFWQVTGDALDFAMVSHGIEGAALRTRLMELYLTLDAYPEVPSVLRQLKSNGYRCAILSNGSPRMLDAAVAHAGIAELLDAVISVEDAGIYKPHPSVYQLAVDRLALPATAMTFQSSNGWDAYAAKAFGFRTVWINRFAQPAERLPEKPDEELRTLTALLALLSGGGA